MLILQMQKLRPRLVAPLTQLVSGPAGPQDVVSPKGRLKQPRRFKEGITENLPSWLMPLWEMSRVGQARKGSSGKGSED